MADFVQFCKERIYGNKLEYFRISEESGEEENFVSSLQRLGLDDSRCSRKIKRRSPTLIMTTSFNSKRLLVKIELQNCGTNLS